MVDFPLPCLTTGGQLAFYVAMKIILTSGVLKRGGKIHRKIICKRTMFNCHEKIISRYISYQAINSWWTNDTALGFQWIQVAREETHVPIAAVKEDSILLCFQSFHSLKVSNMLRERFFAIPYLGGFPWNTKMGPCPKQGLRLWKSSSWLCSCWYCWYSRWLQTPAPVGRWLMPW